MPLKATPTYNWETPWSTLSPVGGIFVAAKIWNAISAKSKDSLSKSDL